ncbi:MAG: cyclase family protein [Gammaproteobacteria bacterium]
MQWIDLSLTIEPNQSEPVPVEIEWVDHKAGASILGQSIGLTEHDFPGGMALSTEYVSLSSHTGTHIDAPIHYGPYCEGRPAKDIAQLPLDWFCSDGVVLRFNGDPDQGVITLKEVVEALDRIQYKIKSKDIVLLETGADKRWGRPDYFTRFRGVSRAACAYLIDQGVKVIGVDTWGFDPPFDVMLAEYQNTSDSRTLWPAHLLGREKEYCQIERLANLSSIPTPYGFKVYCFPVKLGKSGASWTRAVAQL